MTFWRCGVIRTSRPTVAGSWHWLPRTYTICADTSTAMETVVKLLSKRWWFPIGARAEGLKLEPEGPRAEVGFPIADQGFRAFKAFCLASWHLNSVWRLGSTQQSNGSQQKCAGSQLWGTGSVIRGSGSQTTGAGSEIRRDPPQFNPWMETGVDPMNIPD